MMSAALFREEEREFDPRFFFLLSAARDFILCVHVAILEM